MSETVAAWRIKGPRDLESVQNVSRETIHNLERFVALVFEWQKRMNLVSEASLGDIWQRHVADSAQLAEFIPESARTIVDLGSGAGFPGLVLAIILAKRPGLKVHLIEAKAKKCDFLRAVIAETGAPAIVHQSRIEDMATIKAETITARACAPLAELLDLAKRFAASETISIFPKGKGAEGELTQVLRSWKIDAKLVQSRTDPGSQIIVVRGPLDARR